MQHSARYEQRKIYVLHTYLNLLRCVKQRSDECIIQVFNITMHIVHLVKEKVITTYIAMRTNFCMMNMPCWIYSRGGQYIDYLVISQYVFGTN